MIYRTAKPIALATLSAGALAACTMSGTDPNPPAATMDAPVRTGGAEAILKTAAGATVGRATASEAGGSIRIAVSGTGMPPGTHGVHVHTVGRCDAPDFATAGGHWNPMGKMHGSENPMGPHAGDLPNLVVGADGRGTLTMMLPAGTMAGLLDADGAAFVVHAAADDLKTDPSGNSGGRIACGVFVAA
ncbi:superoxide dismutase family protein [Sphingomonas donggukensis]|uniref:Superoxide dismutase family protein n=1 Tax=Sphingomonas donggukensis TaxID=2949093 RepID=A0ABY4TSC1_9SPHN|nr:superoxide dismutase family protein [Sphingomonas donggukensis]URW74829.1 superoxide dismutase family protein [Sphingomonas donggukensis]